ncbi:Surface protein containing fasciclin-like repeats [Halanaeroarchaeum sp. HSR-CO]|uniref:SwmB domain-containing protein n=1 Tax=Halanaeroarchaeum sp. HSR-CO TaxID=2866382 RepID=UPI00217E8140|nr:SwmB domain-containing protein [Halanaeroarchaeum sp. HSR-CO]UWG47033.1 Surface protein containing fasciclin-like repeats [Halanaeroarchaeum sp. HSR-CO]
MTSKSEQLRAVFLAALMVVSVFGMTVAFAGSAAAAAPNATGLSDTVVQSDATVTIEEVDAYNETETGNSLQIVVENTTDGDGSEDIINIDDSTTDDDEVWDVSFNINDDTTLENGDTADIIIREVDSDKETLNNNDVGSIEIDDDAPTVTPNAPTDGDVVNSQTQEITVDITDDVTANDDLFMTVWVDNNGEINSYEIDPSSDVNNGIQYDEGSGELKITPGTGEVPLLEEGTVDVTVDAEDEAGNLNSTSWSFDFDKTDVTADFEFQGQSVDADSSQITNDENATVSVSLSSSAAEIDDDSVELDIGGTTYDNSTDAYDHTTDTFTVDPANNDNVDAYAEGEYTVTVSVADDTAGNTIEADNSFDFEVDRTPQKVNSVEILGGANGSAPTGDYGTFNNDDARKYTQTVNVTFNNSDVAPSTIAVDVGLADAQVGEFTDLGAGEYGAELDLSEVSAEEEEVEVNVTAAQDKAGNELTNPDADASNTTFDIDTIRPSVELDDPIPPEEDKDALSGLVNFTAFIENTEDVDTYTDFQIIVGAEDVETAESPLDSYPYFEISSGGTAYDDARDVDTTQFADGNHVLNILVEDENNNEYYAKGAFTLDNDDSITVQQNYLSAFNRTVDADRVEKKPVTGEINLSEDVFDEYPEGTTFEVDNGTVEETTDYDPEVHGDATLIADDGENIVRVEVEAVDTGLSVTAEDNPSEIVVESNEKLDSLSLTVETDDKHWDGYSNTVEDLSPEKTDDGYEYTYKVDELPRDGDYKATATASLGDIEATADATFDVDEESDPSVDYAAVIPTSAENDVNSMTVRVMFDEPLDEKPAGISVEGTDAKVIGITSPGDVEGIYDIQFDKEFQTADTPEITFAEDQVEGFNGNLNEDDTSVGIFTLSLGLEPGTTVLSVPAVTGSVDLDMAYEEGRMSGVEDVWEYDAENEEWNGWSPDADDNDLESLKGGEGYVVKVSEDGGYVDLNAENLPKSTDNGPQVLNQKTVVEGWNLVGHYQLGNQTASEALSSIDENTDTYQLGYTGDKPAYVLPGDALWVHADQQDGYSPTQLGDRGPEIFNVDVSGQPVADSDEITISVQVDPDEEPVDSVVVRSTELGIDGLELTENTSVDSQGITFDATVTADVDTLEGPANLQVSAFDTANNFDIRSNSVEVDLLEPAFDSAEVTDANADQLRVTFDADVSASQATGFSVTSDGDAVNVNGFSAVENSDTVVLNLDRSVVNGETITASYDGSGDVTSSVDGSAAQTFTDESVTNNVAPIEPAFSSAEVTDANADQLRVTFDADVSASQATGFSVTSDGDAVNVNGFSAVENSDTVVLNLDRSVVNGETITASYDGSGDVTSSVDGSAAQTFTDESVTNNVAPIEPAFSSAEVTDANADQLRVTFDADVSASQATGFSVTSDGDAVNVNGFSAVENSDTVVLNLDRSVVNGETITASYDGSGDVTSSVDGSAAQTFTDESVTNNVA